MAASQLAPQSTVQAARLLLDRLKALALEPSIEGQDVHSTLLAVPEDKRDHVLAVLGELVGRTSDRGFEDLAQGARLVLDAGGRGHRARRGRAERRVGRTPLTSCSFAPAGRPAALKAPGRETAYRRGRPSLPQPARKSP